MDEKEGEKIEYNADIQKVCIEGIFTMLIKVLPKQDPKTLYLWAVQIENERHDKNDKQ